jgi:glucose-6-phosphate 1-dehydrogenase
MRCSSPVAARNHRQHPDHHRRRPGRGKARRFYDQTGALRDMVQNHALQLLCAIGMEPPINAHADAIRDEKLKVLRSLKPWTAQTLAQHVVRGQYAAGT